MKVYVASSWREPLQPMVVEELRNAGHEVYDFRNPGFGNHGFSWSEIDPNWEQWTAAQFQAALHHPIAERGFRLDYDAMCTADVFVHVVPQTAGRSSHLELGWAAGACKCTIILLQEGEPELMYRVANHVVRRVEDVVAILDGLTACAVCGCTEVTPCLEDNGPCAWSKPIAGIEPLCTSCADHLRAFGLDTGTAGTK